MDEQALSEAETRRRDAVYVIAEAGVNHNGDVGMAHRLIDAAADAGADAVKFQTFTAEAVVAASAPKAEYQKQSTDAQQSQLAMLKTLELDRAAHISLIEHCAKRGIDFLSTPFDRAAADLLDELGVHAFKIASGEITNWPFLQYVAAKRRPLFLSTGMSDLAEISEAVSVVRAAGATDITLLHCVSEYPADPAEVNLRAIPAMSAAFGLPVGWSDHTMGTAVSLAAVAVGAVMIEKHFTLDRSLPGPDHQASLEPGELTDLMRGVRTIEAAMGDGIKRPQPSEIANRAIVRRSLAIARDVAEGQTIDEAHLTELRPADGIAPRFRDIVIGRTARVDLRAGTTLKWQDLA